MCTLAYVRPARLPNISFIPIIPAMKSLDEVLPLLTGPGCPFEIKVQDIGTRRGLRCWKTGPQTAQDVWRATAKHPQDSTYLKYYGDAGTGAACG
jgi:hypothetical protein